MGRINLPPEELMNLILSKAFPKRFVRQHKFLDDRKFMADFADIKNKILIEVEGGIFMRKGGHNSISGILRDISKYNLATLNGWRVLRYTSNTLNDVVEDLRRLQ